jgi:hypothetical protein
MRRSQAVILLSRVACLAAVHVNVKHPPADDLRELAARSLEPGEWVVGLQGHEGTIHASSGANVSKSILVGDDGDNVRAYVIRQKYYVRIPAWFKRLGNNLQQLFHAIVYAESERIPRVIIPEGGHVRELFDLPRVIYVQPRLLPKPDCNLSFNAFYQTCTLGFNKIDFRRALLTYVKPHLKQDVQEVCQSKDEENPDLVIHIRGGDLHAFHEMHPQSRMPPCSYYRHLIATHQFQSVRLVVEDGDRDLYCGRQLLSAFRNSTSVVVRQTDHSLIDDACTLMTSQYVAFGLSTFPESLSMMSGTLKKVYVPTLKANGRGQDILYGSDRDMAGTLDCDGFYRSECDSDFIEYILYDIPGLEEVRREADKAAYMFKDGVSYSQLKTCGHCA